MRRTPGFLLWVVCGVLIGSSDVLAAFSNSVRLSHSARQAGMGGTCQAMSDDGLALICNPAGMAFQEGRVINKEITLVFPHFEYSDPQNDERQGTEGGNGKGLLGDLSFVHRVADSPVAYGMGFFSYSGVRSKYDLNSTILHATTQQTVDFDLYLTHHRFIAGIATQVGPSASIGAGYMVGYEQFNASLPEQFESTVEPAGVAGLKGLVDVDAEGWGQGGLVGAQVKLGPRTRLGATWTAPMWVRLEGDYELTSYNNPTIAAFGVSDGDHGKFDYTSIHKWPQTIAAGIAHQVTDKWLVSADWQWYDWSEAADAFDYTVFNGDNAGMNAVLAAVGSTGDAREAITLDAEDAFIYQVGTEYQVSPRLMLRGGYTYTTNPMKKERTTPLFNGIMQHTVAFGAGTQLAGWDLDLAWSHTFVHSQAVSASAMEGGEYNQSKVSAGADQIFLGMRKRF